MATCRPMNNIIIFPKKLQCMVAHLTLNFSNSKPSNGKILGGYTLEFFATGSFKFTILYKSDIWTNSSGNLEALIHWTNAQLFSDWITKVQKINKKKSSLKISQLQKVVQYQKLYHIFLKIFIRWIHDWNLKYVLSIFKFVTIIFSVCTIPNEIS